MGGHVMKPNKKNTVKSEPFLTHKSLHWCAFGFTK